MSLLNTAISGINAYQKHLTTVGNNISNANTPGYSRQEVVVSSAQSQYMGVGYEGSGVNIDTIRRLTDEFAVEQLRADTQLFKGFETYRDNIEQINTMLGDERTGLNSALNQYFSALQVASEAPGFTPSREALMGAGKSLQDRFNVVSDRLQDMNKTVNSTISANAADINALAAGIADFNERISASTSADGRGQPNDLLDKRDELIRELSEIIGVDVVDSGHSLDVYIGSGQALVLGFEARALEVSISESDVRENDVYLRNGNQRLNITDRISGGTLGGVLEFRETSLAPSQNALGRIAIGFATAFNEQQSLGIDLAGDFGKDLFTDFNDQQMARDRVQANGNNSRPLEGAAELYIDDISQLTTSDYEVRFTGPLDFGYEIVRMDDETVIKTGALSGDEPESIKFDGLELTFTRNRFREGDKITLQPTRTAASDFKQVLDRAAELAFASPLTGEGSLANQGTGSISQGEILDANGQAFAVPGELTPPLLVVFETPTSYSLLDNSDPLRPRDLEPPMRYLPYTPGIANNLMPDRPGETQVTSFTGWLPSVPFTQSPNAPIEWPDNEFNPERIYFETLDSDGKPQLLEKVSTLSGASAQEIASQLSGVPGVTARAFTEMEITNFKSGAEAMTNPDPTVVYLNGFDLTIPGSDLSDNQQMFKEGYIKEVPTVITPDFLANRINSSWELAEKGITAKSDGVSLRIIAESGEDLQLELRGNAARTSPEAIADQLEVGNGQQISLTPTGADTRGLLTENQAFDFSERGPYTYDFVTPYGEPASIELTENYASKEEMLDGIAQKIEAELLSQERIKRNDPWLNGEDAPGRAQVSIDERGEISFKVLMKLEGQADGSSQKITLGGTVDVVMDEGITMRTEHDRGNVFFGEPKALSTFMGYQFQVDGNPEAGDRFEIDFNKDPSGDNRNAEKMIDFQTTKTLDTRNGGASFIESYSQLAERVGTRTRQAQINTDAAKASVEQTTERLQQVSGVNLDEEAARMVRFEQGYNASAQMIKVAQDVFSSLLGAFR